MAFALLTTAPHAFSFISLKETTLSNKIDLVGVNNDFSEEAGNLVRTDSQHISQSFLDDLKYKRDISKVPLKEIIKKLKSENLDGFMATEKSI